MSLRCTTICLALAFVALPALAQTPASLAPPVVTPAPSPTSRTIQGIRNKISAADLPSAESILEVHREHYGDDGTFLMGLGWVVRGALLLGETERASELNADLRRMCDERLARGSVLEKDDSLETALGAAIEVEAQLRAKARGRDAGAAFLRAELAKFPGPVPFRARLHKRLNLTTLTGTPAPELVIEEFVGSKPATLAELRGQPVVIFVFAEGCGDCKAQVAALGRVTRRHAAQGLKVVPLTRYYAESAEDRVREKARIDSVWADVYQAMGPASIVISTESMVRYGGSSTPTFVFIDRRGVVRGYTPTRLTEVALERRVRELLR